MLVLVVLVEDELALVVGAEVGVAVEVGVITIDVELWLVLPVTVVLVSGTKMDPEATTNVATIVACVSGAALV